MKKMKAVRHGIFLCIYGEEFVIQKRKRVHSGFRQMI